MTNYLYDGVFAPHADSQKIFLHTPDGDISYADFTALTDRIAATLVATGLAPGTALGAGRQVGDAVRPLCGDSQGRRCLSAVEHGLRRRSWTISCDASRGLWLWQARQKPPSPRSPRIGAALMTLEADESGTLRDAAMSHEGPFSAVPRDSEDLAAILYTSGTTGRSKGAKLCHRNLRSNAEVLRGYWRFTADDVLLHMLPIYHTHGLFVAGNLLALVGGSMIFLPKYSADVALDWMPKATTMMGVPTFYTRLLDHAGFTREASAHMRLFISGSAPLLAETHRQFEARTGKAILERYGMTETNMSTSNPFEGDRRAGTVGFALPGVEIRIADAQTGAPLPDGEIGIIEQRGDNVFLGGNAGKDRQSFRDDGFFITGDMAVRAADGYISIVGRDKDLIISGGLNVYPKEVEGMIDAIEGVLESAVIGVPHRDFGEAVVAVIVRSDDALEAGTVEAALADQLAKFKQPKAILFTSALPRNSMGKVQKAELRKAHDGLFA